MFVEDTLINIVKEAQNKKTLELGVFINAMENAFLKEGFRDVRSDNEQKNILVIRLDAIGDNVLNSGFLRELRRNYPSAHITLVVNPIVYNLVELCPYVNEVFSIANNPNLLQWLPNAISLCREKLWTRYFDLCLIPRWDVDSYFATILAFISGAKERIGYSTKIYPGKDRANAGYDLLLTKTLLTPLNVIHESDRNFYFLKALGMTVQDTKLEVWYDHRDIMSANNLLNSLQGGGVNRVIISVCNTSMEANKNYPTVMFLTALQLIRERKDCAFVYLGGSDCIEYGEYLKKNLGEENLLNLAGKTSLRETCAVIHKTSMYIGSDTGSAHIAAAFHKPTITINRESADSKKNILSYHLRFSPWKTPKIILQPPHALKPCCDHNSPHGCIANVPHCITQITPEDIVDAFNAMIKIV